jgi:deoxyribonuclease-4
MEQGVEQMLDEVDRFVGLERLKLIHANDSKADLNSAVDRHADIGKGLLGEAAFEGMLAHPKLADLPWVLEVPGADKKGPDEPNVRALKRLAGRPVG